MQETSKLCDFCGKIGYNLRRTNISEGPDAYMMICNWCHIDFLYSQANGKIHELPQCVWRLDIDDPCKHLSNHCTCISKKEYKDCHKQQYDLARSEK